MKLQVVILMLIVTMLSSTVFGWIGTNKPAAAIEYAAGTFVKANNGGVLHDQVGGGDVSKWFAVTVINMATITGYAHSGQSGLTQGQADARVTLIQVWGWLDTDGDGKATKTDARYGKRTTKWVKLSELKPSIGAGAVVGWNVATGAPDTTSAWGDIIQTVAGGTAVPIGKRENWLLLIRVVNTAGDTNLMNAVSGTEQWDDGDTSNGVGSDVPSDKYLDGNGNTPSTADARIDDADVVWVYRPRN